MSPETSVPRCGGTGTSISKLFRVFGGALYERLEAALHVRRYSQPSDPGLCHAEAEQSAGLVVLRPRLAGRDLQSLLKQLILCYVRRLPDEGANPFTGLLSILDSQKKMPDIRIPVPTKDQTLHVLK